MIRLAEPLWLALLGLIPLLWLVSNRRPRLAWPTTREFAARPSIWERLRRGPVARCLALAAFTLALARPQTTAGQVRVASRGVAIVIAVDRSSTMSTAVDGNRRLPEGNNPGVSRLDHARRSLEHFVAKRTNDFLGLVAFARIPERRCPLTLDHPFLIDAARGIQPAAPGDDGTNMGDAIAWSIEELRSVQAARRVVVLLSDGRNEPGIPGALEPIEAARLARSMGAILHTIAIGGGSPSGAAASNATNGPDFELLAEMARAGGGRMFVAADPESLESAFLAIDELEPNPIRGEVFSRYHEQRPLLAAAAFVILLLSLGWAAIRPPSLP